MKRLLAITSALLFAALFSMSAQASTTTISGTVLDAAGNPFNGSVTFALPVAATDTTNHFAILPTPVTYWIRNGIVQIGATLEDTTTLQPANLYYNATMYDQTGAVVSVANYAPVTGNPWNFGMAVPAQVTTSNITYLQPASLALPQSWPGLQTFAGGLGVGTGTPFSAVYSGSGTLTFGAIAGGACGTQNISVSGVTAAGIVFASPQAAIGASLLPYYLTGPNVVGVMVCNISSGSLTPNIVTWDAVIFQH